MKLWNEGWECLFGAIEPLSEADMSRTITIRGEAHSVMQAINRQVAHYLYHCGQIVMLLIAKGPGGRKKPAVRSQRRKSA